jgi:multiple sugar transport system permease protein
LYLPLFVYRNAFSYFRYGYAAAATVWIFALTASIVWLQYRVVRRFRAEWT